MVNALGRDAGADLRRRDEQLGQPRTRAKWDAYTKWLVGQGVVTDASDKVVDDAARRPAVHATSCCPARAVAP